MISFLKEDDSGLVWSTSLACGRVVSLDTTLVLRLLVLGLGEGEGEGLGEGEGGSIPQEQCMHTACMLQAYLLAYRKHTVSIMQTFCLHIASITANRRRSIKVLYGVVYSLYTSRILCIYGSYSSVYAVYTLLFELQVSFVTLVKIASPATIFLHLISWFLLASSDRSFSESSLSSI